ncbi:hypothetical protein MTY_1536 [Moorella thermoacetica Y72]|uniref:Uncharacterized protein n=1 Tax=Moorella thermoacetica Y72 TaxID=1325331 RepID=A0A0S6UBT5_NEOTH|nr:hypothetical protein MTY_1536 [Moorella thermoacetica Y72]
MVRHEPDLPVANRVIPDEGTIYGNTRVIHLFSLQ